MKINLGIHKQPRDGYVHIDPLPVEGQPQYKGDFGNLSPVCDASECKELLAENILDYIPRQKFLQTMENWTSLLRHGGKIVVGGTELKEVARMVLIDGLNPHDASLILHGQQIVKNASYTMSEVAQTMQALGLKIISKELQNAQFMIEAVRP